MLWPNELLIKIIIVHVIRYTWKDKTIFFFLFVKVFGRRSIIDCVFEDIRVHAKRNGRVGRASWSDRFHVFAFVKLQKCSNQWTEYESLTLEERIDVILDLFSNFLILIIKVAFESHRIVTRLEAHFKCRQEIGLESKILIFQLIVEFDKRFKLKFDLVTFPNILLFFRQFIFSLDLKFVHCGRNGVYHFDIAANKFTHCREFDKDEN